MTTINTVRAADAIYTHHASRVMRDRGFDPEDVALTLIDPEVVRPGDGQGTQLFSRGHMTVVADVTGADVVIVTVLLRSYDRWDDTDARRACVNYKAMKGGI